MSRVRGAVGLSSARGLGERGEPEPEGLWARIEPEPEPEGLWARIELEFGGAPGRLGRPAPTRPGA